MKKGLVFLLLVLLTNIFAQDYSFFFEEEYAEDGEEVGKSPLSINSKLNTGTLYIDDTFNAYAKVGFNALFEFSGFDINVDISSSISGIDSISNFPLQNKEVKGDSYFDSLYLRYYHSLFDLEVGLLKPVWGNADGIHVIDFLNPIDYSDPFDPTYLDKKIAQQMLKVNIPLGDNSLVELVYLPKFDGDYTETNGTWTPYYIKNMENLIYIMLLPIAKMENPGAHDELLNSQVKAQAKALAETLELEDSDYFTDSQASARYTTTLNSMDLGFTYFYGFLKQPTIDPEKVLETGKLKLVYNQLHGFGLDIAAQVGMFYLKGEAAYYLTEDLKGNDPSVINNSFNYIAGFDVNLPINNLNFLVQGVGKTVINNNEITKLDPEFKEEYNDIMVMARISDHYFNETLFIEVSGAYDFVHSDYMVNPSIEYKLNDNLSLTTEYSLFEGDDDTDFGQFKNNNNFKIEIEYFM